MHSVPAAIFFAFVALGTGCASIPPHQTQNTPETSPSDDSDWKNNIPNDDQTPQYADRNNGFIIQRPNSHWKFRIEKNLSSKAIDIPVIVINKEEGAQVVVQIAPAVATPFQFAQKLTSGLSNRSGFVTSEISPIPVAQGAVGFDFSAGETVLGRVTILDGATGRVFVLLATWPRNASSKVKIDIDRIMDSIRTTHRP